MTLKELRLPALLLAGFVLAAAAARAEVTEKFSQTYPLAADGTVNLETVNGTVEITAWDKAEVSLEAEKRAKTEDDLKAITLEIEAQPNRLSVKTKYDKKRKSLFGDWPRGSVRYKLMVPAGVKLAKVDVVNADITIRGVRGHVDLDSVNGSIDATGLAAGGRFDTVNGSITAEFDAVQAGDRIVLDSVNGSCRVTLPKDASFALDADNVNGRVTCDFPITLEKSGRHHLRGQVGSGGASVKLDSVNGSLRVLAK